MALRGRFFIYAMYELRQYQREASDAAVRSFTGKSSRNGLIVLPTGCHAKGSGIIMADGSVRKVEDIRVGDRLLGARNEYRTVLELHRGSDDMYRIIPLKGRPFVVNGGHVLSLYKTNEGKGYPSCQPRYDEISVREYVGKSANYKHLHKLYRKPGTDFETSAELPVEPYFIGLVLGDGCFEPTISITTMEPEVRDYIYEFADRNGYEVREAEKPDCKARSYHIKAYGGKGHQWYAKSGLRIALEGLGLYGCHAADKFIPQTYRTADSDSRLMLLAGLLDTDAYFDSKKNCYEYASKSKTLMDDIQFLCRSLGLYCGESRPKVVNGETYYRMTITGDTHIIPTKVARRKGMPRAQKKSCFVTGFRVEHVGVGEYYGFTLDGDHLYCDEQFFVHHNSGKSLVIADIASRLDSPLLVFQPSKEILEQNFAKLQSYGILDASVYSASVGRKEINRITFATIGSVMNHIEEFDHFKYVLIDEAHGVNAAGGQYEEFIHRCKRKVVGLTATPYRLTSNAYGSMLKFLTMTRPRIFGEVIYHVQVRALLDMGFLAKVTSYDLTCIDMSKVRSNSTGADYDEFSLRQEYRRCGFQEKLYNTVTRVMSPKSGVPRKGILVFTRFVDEAQALVDRIPGSAIVTGETPKREREAILSGFKEGRIPVVANVGVLTTGFDYPELDTVIMARPTKSLALYYQCCLSMDTEILTKRGFVTYETIRKDDLVAAYDEGQISFVPIQEIVHREVYDGERMVSFSNSFMDFKVTEDHDMLACSIGSSTYKKVPAIELFGYDGLFKVPVSGIERAKGAALSDDEVAFIGYFVSDGNYNKHNNTVRLTQSFKNGPILERMERVIKKCGMRYTKTVSVRKDDKYLPLVHLIISKGMPRRKEDRERGLTGWAHLSGYLLGCKMWSELYEEFDERQFDIFINAINDADGSKNYHADYDRQTMSICCGNKKDYAERLQSLAARRGYRAHLARVERPGGRYIFMLRLRKVGHSTIPGNNTKDGSVKGKKAYHRSRLRIDSASGYVWCVRDELGTIVTRRNGKIVIMGNCGRAIRPFPGKDGWFIDLCGNLRRFGTVYDLHMVETKPNSWSVRSRGRALTNVML